MNQDPPSSYNAHPFKTALFICLPLLVLLFQVHVSSCAQLQVNSRGSKSHSTTGDHSPLLIPLAKELIDCNWNHVIFLYYELKSNDPERLVEITTLMRSLSIPFTVHELRRHSVEKVVYDEYVVKHHTNFIVISDGDNYEPVLIQLNHLFANYSRGNLSSFPHRSSWLLIGKGLGSAVLQSILDNVVSVELDDGHVHSFKTLMWREGRTREWQTVNSKHIGASRCATYPNKRNGLNGREITWLIMPFAYGAYVTNDSLGRPQYAGLFVDIENEISRILNYTTVLSPPPSDPLLTSVDHYSVILRNGTADFGLLYYSQDYAVQLGLKGIYPLFIDGTVAAYVYNTPPETFTIGITSMGSYDNFIPQLIALSFVYAVLFYKIVSVIARNIKANDDVKQRFAQDKRLKRLSETVADTVWVSKIQQNHDKNRKFEKSTDSQRSKERNYFYNNRVNMYPSSTINTQNKPKTSKHHLLFDLVIKTVIRVFNIIPNFQITEFLGSHFNQSTLMRPKRFSLRLFLFFWCVYVLLITCLFTGTLTAGFVKPIVRPPFTKVDQVLQSPTVNYGSFQNTELSARAESWFINGNPWKGHLQKFPITLNSSPRDFRRFMERPSRKPKVFVYYENLVLNFKSQTNFEDLYVTKDSFQHALLGFVSPPDSELADIISKGMLKLHESGLIWKMSEPYLHRSNQKKPSKHVPLRKGIDIPVVLNIFYLTAILVGVAILTLWIETVVQHYITQYNTQPQTHP